MSEPATPDTDPAPEGYAEFIADLEARVRATHHRLDVAFPNSGVVRPGVNDLPDNEIAGIKS